MSRLVLFNKPFQVLSQFTDTEERRTLADFISEPGIYPAGRLDYDSEGLLLLTDDGQLQHRIASPDMKLPKTYVIQVEGEITDEALQQLRKGVELKDGITKPAKARKIKDPGFAERQPPVRKRRNIPTSWVELIISEGRNRQVRRMSAAVGFPTLRLIRIRIGNWSIKEINEGEYRELEVNLPVTKNKPSKTRPGKARPSVSSTDTGSGKLQSAAKNAAKNSHPGKRKRDTAGKTAKRPHPSGKRSS